MIITLEIDEEAIAGEFRTRRVAILGGIVADELEKHIPLPANRFGHKPSDVWSGEYERDAVVAALLKWAEFHEGIAPARKDWSKERDPDRRWPRSEVVNELGRRLGREAGFRMSSWCPSNFNGCEKCRDSWSMGCMPPDKSGWQFMLEDLAGLSLRQGHEMRSTPSQMDRHGRNRQMVTAGVADVHPHRSDPVASRVVETIRP